jgi:hypothetical protein
MNKEEFYKRIDDLTNETGFDLSKEQKRFAFVVAEQYATSQTSQLEKEIEVLKEKIEIVKNILNDCISTDSAVWTINTAREILYKDTHTTKTIEK